MSNIADARSFLDSLMGYTNSKTGGPVPSSERSTKLGVVDPGYMAGLVRVLFDGETVMSQKGYAWMDTYTPKAGDRVMLVPAGQSYVITGKIETHTAYPALRDLPLGAGISTFNVAHFDPVVTKTETGVVKVMGMVKGTPTDNQSGNMVIARLPAGFRPSTQMYFTSLTADNPVGLVVNTNGIITYTGTLSALWLSLNPITFQTNSNLDWTVPTLNSPWVVYRTPAYAKDELGRVWLRGGAARMTVPSPVVSDTIFTLPLGFRPEYDEYKLSYGFTNDTRDFRHVRLSGTVEWHSSNTTAYTPIYLLLDQSMHVEASIGGWSNPAFTGGWTDYGGTTWSRIQYRKDQDGLVQFRGLMKSGTTGQAAFTLPPGMRPTNTVLLPSVSSGAYARIDVFADGRVVPVYGSSSWFSLDGLNFIPGQ